MLWHIAAVGLLGASIGAAGAWKVQSWRWIEADATRAQSEQETARIKARSVAAAAAAYETQRAAGQAAARVTVREVERVVQRLVYRDVCLDDDGLRLIAREIAGANDPGQPAPAMPAASAPR